jgi:hypothetical protein
MRLTSPATIEVSTMTQTESLRLADKLLLSEVIVWSPLEEEIGNVITYRLAKASYKETVIISEEEKRWCGY